MSTPRLSPAEALEKFQSAIQASIEAAQVASFDCTQTREAETILGEGIEELARRLYEPATDDHFQYSDGVEEVIWNVNVGPVEEEEFRDYCYESAGTGRVAIYYSDAWDFANSHTQLCDQAAQEFGIEFDANDGIDSFISDCARYGLLLDVSGAVSVVYNAFQNKLEEELGWLCDLRDDLAELESDQEI